MSEALERLLVSVRLIWMLALLRLMLYCSLGVGASFLGSMSGREWDSMAPSIRTDIKITIALGLIGNILAFVDKSIHQLSRGEILPPDFGTTTILKRQSETNIHGKPKQSTHSVETTTVSQNKP